MFFKHSNGVVPTPDMPKRVRSPTSAASTSMLAEGYTEDGQLSRYENVRTSEYRPASQFSIVSTLNSRIGQSLASVTDEKSSFCQVTPRYSTMTSEPFQMLQRVGHRETFHDIEYPANARPPSDLFGKLKFFYDRYKLRHIAPFLLLFVYSLAGAYAFYLVEHDYEKLLIKREKQMLDVLRNETINQLREMITNRRHSDETKLFGSRDILVWFEKELEKKKLPKALPWDMWGALFYVGTIFTTIGYGNIRPATTMGRVLTIVYAFIGIPLVLAILSQFGKLLTTWTSDLWIKYRQRVKFAKVRALKGKRGLANAQKRKGTNASERPIATAEEGRCVEDEQDEEEQESRTIPVWLALFVCVGYICGCAALFLLWETRWNYFTSLYFFFISLSTIGLGDVVPDKPHMLILMFWLVIIGLSIVSMLLSVIQIKFEEWLYHLMIRMQKEYRKALESGDHVKKEQILAQLMEKQPWYMRNMAAHFISDNQAAKLEHEAETFDRIIRTDNNKNIQTESADVANDVERHDARVDMEPLVCTVGVQADILLSMQDGGNDAMSAAIEARRSASAGDDSSLSDQDEFFRTAPTILDALPLQASGRREDSVSDATSLPMDPIGDIICMADRSQQIDPLVLCDNGNQTDSVYIPTAQAAEVLKETADASMATSLIYGVDKSMKTDAFSVKSFGAQVEFTPHMECKSTETDHKSLLNRSMETEVCTMLNRSMETDAGQCLSECSRSVQTAFPDADEAGESSEVEHIDAQTKRRRFSNAHTSPIESFDNASLMETRWHTMLAAKL
ncbi:S-phase kinase-associated protein 1A [Aphelenchoides avenae]|nr:S-phase kinase-associated protein 1A [Aphelenchus avenae]